MAGGGSSNVPSIGKGGSNQGQDFDLNLAPIIDCLVVLISFLLASAAFLSIGMLDAGISAGGVESKDTPPPVTITVELKAGKSIVLKVEGKSNSSSTIRSSGSTWDFSTLVTQLKETKSKWSAVNAATLTADDGVEYRELVLAMDQIRQIFPAVMLGGF